MHNLKKISFRHFLKINFFDVDVIWTGLPVKQQLDTQTYCADSSIRCLHSNGGGFIILQIETFHYKPLESLSELKPVCCHVLLTRQVCQVKTWFWLVLRWLTLWRAVWASSPASGRSWRSGRQAPQKKSSTLRRRSSQVNKGNPFIWIILQILLLISFMFIIFFL